MHCAASAGAGAAADDDAESNQHTWEGQRFLTSLIVTAELGVRAWNMFRSKLPCGHMGNVQERKARLDTI